LEFRRIAAASRPVQHADELTPAAGYSAVEHLVAIDVNLPALSECGPVLAGVKPLRFASTAASRGYGLDIGSAPGRMLLWPANEIPNLSAWANSSEGTYLR